MSDRAKLTRRNMLVGMALAPIAAVVPAKPVDEWVPLPDLTPIGPISNFDDAMRRMMAHMAQHHSRSFGGFRAFYELSDELS